jgi:hypothetical protein
MHSVAKVSFIYFTRYLLSRDVSAKQSVESALSPGPVFQAAIAALAFRPQSPHVHVCHQS